MIPKIIHQLWIGEIARPYKIMDKWQEMHPDYEYIMWNEEKLKSLRIPRKYKEKIDKWPEIHGQADMYRWIILRDYGGIFVDADMFCIEPFTNNLLANSWFCFENEIERQGLCATTIMAFEKNHKLPNLCIEHILKNYIKPPSWISVGPKLLSDMYYSNAEELKDIDILPSYKFLPEHHTGAVYNGHGKVFATHFWGSTKRQNHKLNNMKCPDHFNRPSKKNFIDIDITNLKEDQLIYFLKSLPFIQGRYNIQITSSKDIDTSDLRWVDTIIQEPLTDP